MVSKSTVDALKRIYQLIQAQNFTKAQEESAALIENDPTNYQVHIFYAYCNAKHGNYAEAERGYDAAINLNSSDHQAWAGLCGLFENLETTPALIAKYKRAVETLIGLYGSSNKNTSPMKLRSIVDCFIEYVQMHGTKLQYLDALSLTVPGNSIYQYLEGIVPPPAVTLEKMARIAEMEQENQINSMIAERRTRLGINQKQLPLDVKREVFAAINLEHIYRELINWTNDDELRYVYEGKLLEHCYNKLLVAPKGHQAAEAAQTVRSLAEGMVIVNQPFKLAWDITLDWADREHVKDYDVNVLNRYCSHFPDSNLCKVLRGYLSSKVSPFRQVDLSSAQASHSESMADAMSPIDDDEDEDSDGGVPTGLVPTTDADRLTWVSEGVKHARSLLGFRLAGEYYQYLEEHEATVELIRKGLDLLNDEAASTGLSFANTKTDLEMTLATALVYYQSPRHHPESKAIFTNILARNPTSTPALLGVGLIFEEEERYKEAIDFLDRAKSKDPNNLMIQSESAWVKACDGDYATAKTELEACIARLRTETLNKSTKKLLALSLYRLGVCFWNLHPSQRERKSKSYPLFVEAIKNDMTLAPAYTMLGMYFEEQGSAAKFKERARRSFQQALELSPSELVAAEHLTRSYADDRKWEHVGLIARRIISSGKIRPPPGSQKKELSWPYAVLGFSSLDAEDYWNAIPAFQSALRVSPELYSSWVGLGEAYTGAGRSSAAVKALLQAQTLEEEQGLDPSETWITKFLLATIKLQLSEFEVAIELFRAILSTHPSEPGVIAALLQTLVQSGHHDLRKGAFGRAIDQALDALEMAVTNLDLMAVNFDFWKAVGDACSLFSFVKSRLSDFPADIVQTIIGAVGASKTLLQDIDGVDVDVTGDKSLGVDLARCLHASILAHKMAVKVSGDDAVNKPITYYNLGWAEYRAHLCLPMSLRSKKTPYLKAALQCFKNAIELESGNAEFWNAFGVVTISIFPAVSQHAFVRSLNINERSPYTWANLGVLGLMQHDLSFATEAFARSQTADPDCAAGWVGQGLISLLTGRVDEARTRFTHAASISDASNIAAKQLYATSMFDYIVSGPVDADVTGPLFALTQLKHLEPDNHGFVHLLSLFQERVGDVSLAASQLGDLCTKLESEYATTNAPETLIQLGLTKVDLARTETSCGKFGPALKTAEEARKLITNASGSDSKTLEPNEREKAILSTHLSTGLAKYYDGNPEGAIEHFKTAIAEMNNDPAAACLLAQVLWASGGADNKDEARDVLWTIVEEHPEHVPTVLLLGAIALADNDAESMEAVLESLLTLRTSNAVEDPSVRRDVADMLGAIARRGLDPAVSTQTVAQTEVILHPDLPHGWTMLSSAAQTTEVTDDVGLAEDAHRATQCAIRAALRNVAPRGQLTADELAETFCHGGCVANFQNAIMIAPWSRDVWEVLESVNV